MDHDPVCAGDGAWNSTTKPCPICALIATARRDERRRQRALLIEDMYNIFQTMPPVDIRSMDAVNHARDYIESLPDE